MGLKRTTQLKFTNYFDFFTAVYSPVLQEIDLLLKTTDGFIPPGEAAKVLHITEESIRFLMAKEKINFLDKPGFLQIMALGESAVCRMFQRELIYGSKGKLSPSDIADIYGLSCKNIENIFKEMKIEACDTGYVPEVLKRVPIYIMY